MAANTIVRQLAKKSGMRNRVKGLTEIEDGNISAEAGIQGPGPIVDRKNASFSMLQHAMLQHASKLTYELVLPYFYHRCSLFNTQIMSVV